MALQNLLYAKENRRVSLGKAGEKVDPVFLVLLLALLGTGLFMLYSASSAQSMYDTGYTNPARYFTKQTACLRRYLVEIRYPVSY